MFAVGSLAGAAKDLKDTLVFKGSYTIGSIRYVSIFDSASGERHWLKEGEAIDLGESVTFIRGGLSKNGKVLTLKIKDEKRWLIMGSKPSETVVERADIDVFSHVSRLKTKRSKETKK